MQTKCTILSILLGALITNAKLSLFKVIDHDTCDFCGDIETTAHLLDECPTMRKDMGTG